MPYYNLPQSVKVRDRKNTTEARSKPNIASVIFFVILLTPLLLLPYQTAWANLATLKRIKIQNTQPHQTEIVLYLSPQASKVHSYQIDNPARIIVDLFNTECQLPNKRVQYDHPQIQSIVSIQAVNRTRLVINLNRPVSFQTHVTSTTVNIIIDAAPPSVPKPRSISYRKIPHNPSVDIKDIKPVTSTNTLKTDNKKTNSPYTGKALSLNFQSISTRAALQIIADTAGLNLVTSDSVTGNVTLRLEHVPWDQALQLIIESKGLASRQLNNVLMVAPADEMAERERKILAAEQERRDLSPLESMFIQIKYAKAYDIATTVNGGDNRNSLLSKRGRALVDERTNTLLLQDVPSSLQAIETLIKKLDIPMQQVLIEARIVVARSNLSSDLGVRWTGSSNASISTGISTIGNNGLAVDLTTGSGAYTNINPGSGTFALGYADPSILVDLELAALASEGKGEIISQPKVITANKRKALIKSGKQIPYREESSSGGTKIAFKDALLALEVTPQITPDEHIIMDLKITQDALGNQEYDGAPAIDTNAIETQVLVNNGETIVLGGIYTSETFDQNFKVPVLGDIPLLGALFRRSEKSQEKVELLIFITPRLIEDNISLN